MTEKISTPLEQHKIDLETVIWMCGDPGVDVNRIRRLAEALLVRLPEESHCANHPADQICPECTA